jgi:hypothetical protein
MSPQSKSEVWLLDPRRVTVSEVPVAVERAAFPDDREPFRCPAVGS